MGLQCSLLHWMSPPLLTSWCVPVQQSRASSLLIQKWGCNPHIPFPSEAAILTPHGNEFGKVSALRDGVYPSPVSLSQSWEGNVLSPSKWSSKKDFLIGWRFLLENFLNLFKKEFAIQRFGAAAWDIGRTAFLRRIEATRQGFNCLQCVFLLDLIGCVFYVSRMLIF